MVRGTPALSAVRDSSILSGEPCGDETMAPPLLRAGTAGDLESREGEEGGDGEEDAEGDGTRL